MSKIHEFEAFKRLIDNDPEYAWALHCNIAMPLMDALGISHEEANYGSVVVMRHLFDADVTKNPLYIYKHDSRSIPICGDMSEALYGEDRE